MTFACATALQLKRLALLSRHGGRAPRYTSYPTAAQFTPLDPATYGDWLASLPADEAVSVYAHIPFCARLCWYCGCNTRVVHRGETVSDYIGLLREELALVQAQLPGRLKASAIHLGGGTPNLTSVDDLAVLFDALRQVFRLAPDAEIAAEIDPAHLTPEWVRAAAFHGLSRASLGVQDLSPEVQAAVNRIEPFEVVARAAGLLRDAGVASLNLDLMYGLPRQRTADVLSTLDAVLTLSPDRLALFGYAHVPWMKAHQKLINEADLAGDGERLEQSEAAAERLTAAGYVRIGLDHYARPDDSLAVALREGRLHRNFQGYTTDQARTLIGVGVSAIGQLPQGYAQNTANEVAWRKAVAEGVLPTARGVAVTQDDRFRAEIIERLMCDFAVDVEAVSRRHGRELPAGEALEAALAGLEQDGVIDRKGRLIAVTELGRPFVRQVCAAFDAYLAPDALRHSRVV
jgi:oxygen-independent coproporphyrinogen-3 oxidase